MGEIIQLHSNKPLYLVYTLEYFKEGSLMTQEAFRRFKELGPRVEFEVLTYAEIDPDVAAKLGRSGVLTQEDIEQRFFRLHERGVKGGPNGAS